MRVVAELIYASSIDPRLLDQRGLHVITYETNEYDPESPDFQTPKELLETALENFSPGQMANGDIVMANPAGHILWI